MTTVHKQIRDTIIPIKEFNSLYREYYMRTASAAIKLDKFLDFNFTTYDNFKKRYVFFSYKKHALYYLDTCKIDNKSHI